MEFAKLVHNLLGIQGRTCDANSNSPQAGLFGRMHEATSLPGRSFIDILDSIRSSPALQNQALLMRELMRAEHAIIIKILGLPQSFNHSRVHCC
jgi:hypothetical protein